MKKVFLTLLATFLIAWFESSCGIPTKNKIEEKTDEQKVVFTFSSQHTTKVYTNLDTVFTYYYSGGSNLCIVKIPFEGKLITVMFPETNTSDFKIIKTDTTSKSVVFKREE